MNGLLYRERPLLALVVLLIVVSGIISFTKLPRLEDPELSQRLAFVFTQFPGADAQQVETLVTDRIEEAFIDEIDELVTGFSVEVQVPESFTLEQAAELVAAAGGLKPDIGRVILGGPMMGLAAHSIETPSTTVVSSPPSAPGNPWR